MTICHDVFWSSSPWAFIIYATWPLSLLPHPSTRDISLALLYDDEVDSHWNSKYQQTWTPIYPLFLGSGQLNLWTPMPLPLVIQSRSNSSAWLAWKILKQIKFLCLYWLKQPFKAEPYGILSLMIYKWVSLYTTGENWGSAITQKDRLMRGKFFFAWNPSWVSQ